MLFSLLQVYTLPTYRDHILAELKKLPHAQHEVIKSPENIEEVLKRSYRRIIYISNWPQSSYSSPLTQEILYSSGHYQVSTVISQTRISCIPPFARAMLTDVLLEDPAYLTTRDVEILYHHISSSMWPSLNEFKKSLFPGCIIRLRESKVITFEDFIKLNQGKN